MSQKDKQHEQPQPTQESMAHTQPKREGESIQPQQKREMPNVKESVPRTAEEAMQKAEWIRDTAETANTEALDQHNQRDRRGHEAYQERVRQLDAFVQGPKHCQPEHERQH